LRGCRQHGAAPLFGCDVGYDRGDTDAHLALDVVSQRCKCCFAARTITRSKGALAIFFWVAAWTEDRVMANARRQREFCDGTGSPPPPCAGRVPAAGGTIPGSRTIDVIDRVSGVDSKTGRVFIGHLTHSTSRHENGRCSDGQEYQSSTHG
jgi:hypothetical protein